MIVGSLFATEKASAAPPTVAIAAASIAARTSPRTRETRVPEAMTAAEPASVFLAILPPRPATGSDITEESEQESYGNHPGEYRCAGRFPVGADPYGEVLGGGNVLALVVHESDRCRDVPVRDRSAGNPYRRALPGLQARGHGLFREQACILGLHEHGGMQWERTLILYRDGKIAALGDEIDGGGAFDREEFRARSVLHLGEKFLLHGRILPPYLRAREEGRRLEQRLNPLGGLGEGGEGVGAGEGVGESADVGACEVRTQRRQSSRDAPARCGGGERRQLEPRSFLEHLEVFRDELGLLRVEIRRKRDEEGGARLLGFD